MVAQRVTHQLGRDVHDLDHAVIGHTRGADHAQRADALAVDLVGGADDGQFFERHYLAFAADVDAHALGAAGDVEQAQQLGLLLEQVESAAQAERVYRECGRPVIAMIESVKGLIEANAIAAATGTAALFVGTNDLRVDLHIPEGTGRAGLTTALQMIVMAARLSGKAVFDGVYNRLDDPDGFMEECKVGHEYGFDGKTLIHPNQIAAANMIFGPSLPALEDAYRLVAAASGGAERFEGRMIEAMHVAAARSLIARAEACGMGR